MPEIPTREEKKHRLEGAKKWTVVKQILKEEIFTHKNAYKVLGLTPPKPHKFLLDILSNKDFNFGGIIGGISQNI